MITIWDRMGTSDIAVVVFRNRARTPFFDSARHTQMMEAAYRQMWRNAQSGAPAKGFVLTLEAAL